MLPYPGLRLHALTAIPARLDPLPAIVVAVVLLAVAVALVASVRRRNAD